jgi:ADP-ribose pyrophosphatase
VSDDPRPPRQIADAERHLEETPQAGEWVYDGALLHVRRDIVRLPDGGSATREYVVHAGAVLIVPVQDDGTFIVERQHRYPMNRVFTEFPAGKLDPGETPLATAQRELREEAGYAAARWTRLGVIHPVVSYSTEAIEFYVAEGLSHVGRALDDGEFLDIAIMSADAMLTAIDGGEITDAKTIAALFMYLRRPPSGAIARRVIVRGRVQGVGFRYAMVDAARAAGVAGWVRNCRDGTVEALVQGDAGAVLRMIAWCRRGPPAARVDSAAVDTELPDPRIAGFEQRPMA